jgi:hypothetical protein
MGADDAPVEYSPDEKTTLQKAKELVLETETIRMQTDVLIDKLSDPSLRQKYVGKRLELRSRFQNTVGDLINKFIQLADEVKGFFAPAEKPKPATIFARLPPGKFGSYEGEDMGILPAIFGAAWISSAAVKVAIIALAVVIIAGATYFASKNAAEKSLQQEILNDKTLPVQDKVDLINAVTGSNSVLGKAVPWLLLASFLGLAWYNKDKFFGGKGATFGRS